MHDLVKDRCIYCGSDIFFDGGKLLIKCEMCGHTLVITQFENELNRMKEAIREGEEAKAALETARQEKQEANERLFSVINVLDDISMSQEKEEVLIRQIRDAFSDNEQTQKAMLDLLHSLHSDAAREDTLLSILSTLSEARSEAGQKLNVMQGISKEILESQDDLAAKLQMQSDVVKQIQALAIDTDKKQDLVREFIAWSQNIQEEDYNRLKEIESSAGVLLSDQQVIDAKIDLLQATADKHQKTLEKFHSQWKQSQLEEMQRLYQQAESFQYDREYDKAEEYYRQVITKGGADAEVYWRLLLCHYCVSYQKSDDGRLIPIILNPDLSDPQEMSLRRDLENSILPDQRKHYEEELSKIDAILNKYRQVHSDIKYDVFISVKQQKDGRNTIDSDIASSLYDSLTEKGLKVFNSRRCKAEMAGKLYEPYIISALMSAKALIVVGTSAENMNSQWVKNEWTRYQWLQRREIQQTGKTDRMLLCYLAMGMSPREIPRALNPSRQAVLDGINADKEISTALQHLIPQKSPETPPPQPVPEQPVNPAPQPQPQPQNMGRVFMVLGIVIGILALALVLSMSGILGSKKQADSASVPVQESTAVTETATKASTTEKMTEPATEKVTETEKITETKRITETEKQTERVIKTKQIGKIGKSNISATATSQLPYDSAHGKDYKPENLLDDNLSTAYVEGVSGNGTGEQIYFSFDQNYEIHRIVWHPGYQASDHDLFYMNGYPEKIRLEFSDGSSMTSTAYDASYDTSIEINFETPVITNKITVTILEATVGTHFDDTCISGFEFYGTNDLY